MNELIYIKKKHYIRERNFFKNILTACFHILINISIKFKKEVLIKMIKYGVNGCSNITFTLYCTLDLSAL